MPTEIKPSTTFVFDIVLRLRLLTHWGRDKMDAIWQTTLPNAFSWMKKMWISIKISLKFVPKGPINNIPALDQIMAWRRPGDKPLSAPMMVKSLTHIGVTRPQWVNAATGSIRIWSCFYFIGDTILQSLLWKESCEWPHLRCFMCYIWQRASDIITCFTHTSISTHYVHKRFPNTSPPDNY